MCSQTLASSACARIDVLLHVGRVRARVADAVEARRCRRARTAARRTRGRGRRRRAVGVDVLAEQRDLAHAVGGQAAHLGDELLQRPRHLAAARRGHDAVRADHVAAGGDLHPALEVAAALGRQVAGEALELEEALGGDASRWSGTRRACGPGRARTPRRRTGTGGTRWSFTDCAQQPPTPITRSGSRRLSARRLAQVGDEALVGLLADRAGVEQDQVGVLARRRLRVAERLEHALHALGVVLVHLAPEGGHVEASWRYRA